MSIVRSAGNSRSGDDNGLEVLLKVKRHRELHSRSSKNYHATACKSTQLRGRSSKLPPCRETLFMMTCSAHEPLLSFVLIAHSGGLASLRLVPDATPLVRPAPGID